MYQKLTSFKSSVFPDEKIQVPYGFAVTASSYKYFIESNNLDKKIKDILETLKGKSLKELTNAGTKIRNLILNSSFPKNLSEQIITSYKDLAEKLNIKPVELDVAVRSSATTEDLPDASFAGQQETYLNIKGEKELLLAIKKSFSSLFTDRAISYRMDQGFNQFDVLLSVAVQKMVRSDRGCSGVMFTLDTESGFKDVVLINASWGLGEYIVKGVVTPDEYIVFKPTLKQGFSPIISKKLGSKIKKLIYSSKNQTKEARVTKTDRDRFVLENDNILKLSKWGIIIEDHYKKPMDIEWALDSVTKKLFIVQARPETIHKQKTSATIEDYQLLANGKVILSGTAVGTKIGAGNARFIKSPQELNSFKKGEVLVAHITDPDWEPIMKIASAIVTDSGGRTSHAAIVSRELGIPAIVGSGNGTKILTTGKKITVSCADGEIGKVYEGILDFKINTTDISNFKMPKTQIKMIIANPELAFKYSFIPNNGVGLAREEFIISNYIKIHPNALINYLNIKDKKEKNKIDKLTIGYKDKINFYIEKLSQGISIIAAAFYPNKVLLRFSDFKSNEYANLVGGREFEPVEENPMLGWRGASRYYDPLFEKAFSLECMAVKRVIEKMGLSNLEVMIPFCRTPEEGKKVIAVMKKYGLDREKNKKLRVFVMAEIPSNVLQLEDFAKVFDGFSIGSNDLTQLTLGMDRDSKLIAGIGNEKNKSVVALIKKVIKEGHALKKEVGICGQGPSDFPELAKILVEEGIDSISLNPDAVIKTAIKVKEFEDKK